MVSVLVVATLAAVAYSLWVRRDTWWTRWEVGITVGLALEGVALLLLSPWGTSTFGPPLHRAVGLWNVGHLLGWLCVIPAIIANTYHVLVRMVDPAQARAVLRRHLRVPVLLGLVLMVTTFVIADEEALAHGFGAADTSGWFDAFWVVTGSLLIFLSGYATRVLLPLKADPRARETYRLYQASTVFAVAAFAIQMVAVWFDFRADIAVWSGVALSVSVFAIGSARSWQAKAAWFSPNRSTNRLKGDVG
ncbi:hypothetical protein KIH27_16170 [Mycobacterium sp. M1]|uniref:GP55 protein n=1 Tax=Mycolicibacter acidiphilus TaxID=2835306 RepID=A0ABS5RLR9_9MYCO|nr:hypothetical protein [Mycolicibacter acidiphilus]MBS9535124.1 hypothetical protein [Mycolicibacter acidiphilus]